uniref:Uncharacterized protein n=1 Tax=Mustela putorius furo TaxID=9669 RepID=M3Z8W7_MUSPF
MKNPPRPQAGSLPPWGEVGAEGRGFHGTTVQGQGAGGGTGDLAPWGARQSLSRSPVAGAGTSPQPPGPPEQAPSGVPRSSPGGPLGPCSRCCRSWACRALLAMARTRLWLREEERRRKPGGPGAPSPTAVRLVGEVMSSACWKPVSQRSCSVRASRRTPRPARPSLASPRLWPRTPTWGAKSSAVRSPRLLDLAAAGQSQRPARGRRLQGGLGARGRGESSSSEAGSWPAARRLGLDLLLVTADRSRRAAVAEQGRRGRRPARAPATLSRPRPRPGRERSMTVSLDDTLEDEDTLSRWPPGSSRRHSRSPLVASEYTVGQGPARGRRPPRSSEGTCPSLMAFLTIWLLGVPSHAPPGPPPLYTLRRPSRAGSVSPLLRVLGWKGMEAPRATAAGLATLAPGPEAHRAPPGEGLGGAATRGGGPGPRDGSSAMVSRPHREEPVLGMEKGRVSVGKRRGACWARPPWTGPAGPSAARPLPVHTAAPPPGPPALLLLGLGEQRVCAHGQGPQGPLAGQGWERPRAHRLGPITWHAAALSP